MRMDETMCKADWRIIVSRVAGVLVLLVGVLLATRMCMASPHDNPAPSIFEPHSTPAESIYLISCSASATGFSGRVQLIELL